MPIPSAGYCRSRLFWIRVFPGASLGTQRRVPRIKAMFPFDCLRRSERQSSHDSPPARPFALPMAKEGDVFDAFLDEFTGGSSLLSRDVREEVNGEEVDGEQANEGARPDCTNTEKEDKGETGDRKNAVAPSSSHAPTAERDKQLTAERGNQGTHVPSNCSAVTGEVSTPPRLYNADAATACSNIGPAPVRGISTAQMVISYSSVRSLTNPTYLRRLNLSKEDAISLFPEAQATMYSVFAKDARRCDSPGKFWKSSTSVGIQDPEGRQWQVVLECLRTSSQRHVRLIKGWEDMCILNGLSVGMIVRLDRWEQAFPSASSREALVTVSIL